MPIVGLIVGAGIAAAGIMTKSAISEGIASGKRGRAQIVMRDLGPIFLAEGITVNDLWYVFENGLKERKLSRRKVRKYSDEQWNTLLREMRFNERQRYLLTVTWREEKKNCHLRTVSYTDPREIDLVRGIGRAGNGPPPPIPQRGSPVSSSCPVAPPSRGQGYRPPPRQPHSDADDCSDIASEGDSDYGPGYDGYASRSGGGGAARSCAGSTAIPPVDIRREHLPPTLTSTASQHRAPAAAQRSGGTVMYSGGGGGGGYAARAAPAEDDW